MRTCVAALLTVAAFTPVFAQEIPPPTITRVEPKQKSAHVWTNDDIGTVGGNVNVMGPKDTAEKPSSEAGKPGKDSAPCESDAWSATVATVLKAQKVPLDGRFWSERLFGGACIDKVSVAAVAARIAGDYTLDDGRRLRLKTNPVAGLPPASQIVGAIDQHRPLIVKWQGQPLVLTKVDYIDRQYDYVSTYSISSLMLTNVLTGRLLIFDAKTHSDKDVEGSFQISVEER
ncbi:MAG: hypothetical protein ACRD3E_03985 [Terriglobales bacterium]